MIENTCPHCNKKLRLAEDHIGKMIHCPSCQQSFIAYCMELDAVEGMIGDSPLPTIQDEPQIRPLSESVQPRSKTPVTFRQRIRSPSARLVAIKCFMVMPTSLIISHEGFIASKSMPSGDAQLYTFVGVLLFILPSFYVALIRTIVTAVALGMVYLSACGFMFFVLRSLASEMNQHNAISVGWGMCVILFGVPCLLYFVTFVAVIVEWIVLRTKQTPEVK